MVARKTNKKSTTASRQNCVEEDKAAMTQKSCNLQHHRMKWNWNCEMMKKGPGKKSVCCVCVFVVDDREKLERWVWTSEVMLRDQGNHNQSCEKTNKNRQQDNVFTALPIPLHKMGLRLRSDEQWHPRIVNQNHGCKQSNASLQKRKKREMTTAMRQNRTIFSLPTQSYKTGLNCDMMKKDQKRSLCVFVFVFVFVCLTHFCSPPFFSLSHTAALVYADDAHAGILQGGSGRAHGQSVVG